MAGGSYFQAGPHHGGFHDVWNRNEKYQCGSGDRSCIFSGRSDVSGYDRDTFSAGSGCIVRETAGTEERRIKRQIKNETAGFPVMEPGSLRIM